jgi:hypothetical protein
MKYYFHKLIIWSLIGIFGLLAFFSTTHAVNDLLNKAFDEAKKYDYIINPGNTKEAVGWQVFNPTVDINILSGGKLNDKDNIINIKEPYYIRITKLILRVMIAISVSIIIFAWISYALAFGEGAKQKKAQDMVIYALLGVLLGLWALAIIQLTLTITKSTLSI